MMTITKQIDQKMSEFYEQVQIAENRIKRELAEHVISLQRFKDIKETLWVYKDGSFELLPVGSYPTTDDGRIDEDYMPLTSNDDEHLWDLQEDEIPTVEDYLADDESMGYYMDQIQDFRSSRPAWY